MLGRGYMENLTKLVHSSVVTLDSNFVGNFPQEISQRWGKRIKQQAD